MRVLFFIVFVLNTVFLYSQTAYNTFTHQDEWLQPNNDAVSKEFIKFKVTQKGIYRIGYDALVSKGFSFSNEIEIQLFRKGVEQAIFIQGNGDGFNNTNDYIEFYAEPNDGSLDEELYFPKNLQPHKHYSLFSDSAAYFLTSSSGATGKRVQAFTSSAATPEPFYLENFLKLYTDSYAEGKDEGQSIRVPFYNKGEGWFSVSKGKNGTFITQFEGVNQVYNTSEADYTPMLELLLVGDNRKNQEARIEISKDGSSYSVVNTTSFNNWEHQRVIIPLSYSDISGVGDDFYVRVTVVGDESRVRLGYVKLEFARNTNFSALNEGILKLKAKAVGQTSTINFTNLSGSNLIYEINENGNYRRAVNTSTINVIHQQLSPKLYFTNTSLVNQLGENRLKKISLKMPETDNEFVILASSKLQNGVNKYKNYRSLTYKTAYFFIEDIYDIFTYGDFTPAAIRRFCDYLITNGDYAQYLFLIGKGVKVDLSTANYGTYRHNPEQATFTRNGVTVTNFNDVPPMGTPGSDIVYSCNIFNDSTWVPHIPTGRITAISNNEVEDYLQKVQEYEMAEDAPWKKRILHLGGGKDQSEINNFKSYLKSWENIAEGEYFGGNVSTIIKSTTGLQNIRVDDQVNEGVRLITFFGHSTTLQSDIDIGNVSDINKGYNNSDGKYPIILLNGCRSGNFYGSQTGFGEDWIMTGGKGAIAFISSSTVAYANTLRNYTNHFYTISFADSAYLETTIGNIIQKVNKNINHRSGTSTISLGHYMNINILGDPAIPLFNKVKPDLEINNSSIFLQPIDEEVVTAVSDTFNLGIIINNFGKFTVADSFYISVERTYNGITVNYPPKMYKAVANHDTVYFGISSPNILTYGLNNFKIEVDYNSIFNKDRVDETNEDNNLAIFQQVIPLSGVFPIFPREFEIISLSPENEYNQPWILTAQSTNLMVEPRDYIFEIDTSMLFNSGGIKHFAIVNGEAEVSWNATNAINEMLLSISNSIGTNPDSVIFYWRVKYKDLLEGESELWGYSSFMYNYQSPGGWAQAHYYQFLRDKFKYLTINPSSRNWEFTEISSSIRYSTTGPRGIPSDLDPTLPKLTQDNIPPGYIYTNSPSRERGRGLLVNVYDHIELNQISTLLPVGSPGVRENGRYYYFRMDLPDHIANFVQLINNVSDNDYVAILTKDSTNYSDWSELNDAFAAIGAQNFPPNDSIGYAIMGRKNGNAIFERYIYGATSFDTAVELVSNLNFGYNTSTIIGPVTQWNKLYRNIKKENIDDNWSIDVYGITVSQTDDTLLYSGAFIDGFDLNIDADEYPYLKLRVNKEDITLKTPPQLKNWLVTYKAEIPEGVIVASKDVDDYSSKEYYEGQKRTYNFRFKNISKYEFKDSLHVVINLISEATALKPIKFKIKKPAPGEYTNFSYEIDTKGLEGNYNLQVTVNPSIEVEHYYHNNSLSVPFYVVADKIHPILDVTFDGVHIMDYDIVSPKTTIEVRMKDENKFLFKQNLDGMIMQLAYPEEFGGYIEEIQLEGNNEVEFTPASKNHPNFEIKYRREKPLEDGEYKLIVQVQDEIGNKSGTNTYEVHFTVINQTTITNFFPYPNPFSTSMRFAYTLTGSDQPDQIKIQIMTISGKIVREITQHELGRLKIGKHLTDFVWDGTDEFGSRLANGVYLYRVIANIENNGLMESITARNAGSENTSKKAQKHGVTNADALFKKGWGKIYIMR